MSVLDCQIKIIAFWITTLIYGEFYFFFFIAIISKEYSTNMLKVYTYSESYISESFLRRSCHLHSSCLCRLVSLTFYMFMSAYMSLVFGWVQTDFNFSNKATFTLSCTWSQMIFDILWPHHQMRAPSCIYDPTLVEIHQSMWKLRDKC